MTDLSAFIRAQVTLLSPEAGGRRTAIASGYRCNCRLPDHGEGIFFDATFRICDVDRLNPGETVMSQVEPHHPDDWISVEVGTVIEMCEGPRLIGRAVVTELFGDSEWAPE